MLQIAANIFDTNVRQFEVTNSAALGAALRSSKSYYDSTKKIVDWTDLVNQYIDIQKSVVIKPNKKYSMLYKDMLNIYRKYENFVLKNGGDPEHYRKDFVKKYFDI